jgi:MFS family permease
MTLMALQPLYGRVYTLFNTKSIFLSSLLLFEVGSTICATAQNSPMFIAGRALSGSGAAGIMSGALSIGGHIVPLVKRPLYLSVIMSMYGVAAIAGPTLGGVFTDSRALTWRFCFYLNLRKLEAIPTSLAVSKKVDGGLTMCSMWRTSFSAMCSASRTIYCT